MQILFWLVVLIVCLITLVKAADIFTSYSEKVGLALGLSSFIIGATIVAVGTSLPELVSSMFAVLGSGTTEFVADNIIGSNVANALLILGIGAVVAKTLTVKTSLIDVDLPFFFMSMALFSLFALDGQITRFEGVFLLGFFIIFLIYSVKPDSTPEEIAEDKEEIAQIRKEYQAAWGELVKTKAGQFSKSSKETKKKQQIGLWIFYIVVSALAVTVSAKFLIDSVLTLSELLGISSSLLTITVVALGTSLPELITAISAIRMGNHAIAIGNVFGSNTFNLLLVGGLPALFSDLAISELTFVVGLPFLVVATFAAIFTTLDNKIRLWEGGAMLFLYAVFIAKVTQII